MRLRKTWTRSAPISRRTVEDRKSIIQTLLECQEYDTDVNIGSDRTPLVGGRKGP